MKLDEADQLMLNSTHGRLIQSQAAEVPVVVQAAAGFMPPR